MKARLILIIFLSGFVFPMVSAQVKGVLNQLPEDEKEAVEAIALYPVEERADILIVAMHPEILVRMEHIRKSTEEQFKELISGLPEEDQKRIYNLSRYPELLAAMAGPEKHRTPGEMEELLKPYAEEIHEDAIFLNRKHFDLVKHIHAMDMKAEADFKLMLAPYPVNVQEASRRLARLPAVLSVLTTNMSMTVLLGDIYKTHPDALDQELDSLNLVLAEQQAKELDEWKQELEKNPEAMGEYEQAAREFAGEETYDYDDDVYEGPIPDRYREEVYVHHVWRPYSYWFGWPSWYSYECWYPYPWWYHWGYYYGPGHAIVIVGLPSTVFIDWHFRHHRHFYHYPHFTDQVIRHYYGPRRMGTRVQPVLRRWEEQHRGELPSNWWNDDKNRVDRIREYGKFKTEYEDLARIARDKAPTEREYLRNNVDRYPTLKPVLKEKPEPRQPPKDKVYIPTPEKQPVYRPEEKVIQKEEPKRQEEIDRAKEKHENIWDRQRTEPKQQPAPPKTEKQKTKAPTRTEPTKPQPPKTQPRTVPAKKEPAKTQPRKDR